MKYISTVGDRSFAIEVIDDKTLAIDGRRVSIDFESIDGQPVYSMLMDGQSHEAYVYQSDSDWEVLLRGRQYAVSVIDEREQRLRSSGASPESANGDLYLKAPMPGLVVAIPVQPDQLVEKGQVLLILESMKMQNELRAPKSGRVSRLKVKPGETVEQKQILLTLS